MNNETYQRRAKLKMRLERDLAMLHDCLTRFADNLEELQTDYAEFPYLGRQLGFSKERVQIMLDRLRDYEAEYPAELEQRGC